MSKINNGREARATSGEDNKEGRRPLSSTSEEVKEEPKQEPKPKRKCSEKQLEALAAGRAKNSRFKPKQK